MNPVETGPAPRYAVVIPTIGRPSLQACVDALAAAARPLPRRIVVVDDRRRPAGELPLATPDALRGLLTVVPSGAGGGRGPAAARNAGWRAVSPDIAWIVFLDDDVQVRPGWGALLAGDLAVGPDVGGVQGTVTVPVPAGRRPTDWERNVSALAGARWITADMAYRRDALTETAGFDERFTRAYREDADLALRVREAGWTLVRGARRTRHPVRPADRWISVRLQQGNADDALMRRLHGRGWYERADASRGRRTSQAAITAAAGLGLLALAAGRRRRAAFAAAGWLVGTARFAAARIAPGPRTASEITTMLVTSVLIPPVATLHRGRGWWKHRCAGPWPGRPAAVLFDRDGTLVVDVPFNGDREQVALMPGAVEALRLLRAEGIPAAVITNQSGVARGLLTAQQVGEVNSRVEELLGPFAAWAVCPHGPADGCRCRKPAPGLVRAAAEAIGVAPQACVVIGDIGSDVAAARAAGSRSVLVPTPETLAGELAGARVATDLVAAVRWILGSEGVRS
ncbi:MAG: HAD-IIIA family hydrolase [Catenulispora sp.]